MRMKVDMHFHTNHSDGAATVDQVLHRMRELNIGVAITDHNEISASLEAIRKKKSEDTIIPGIEVKSKEYVDVLFYFYDEKEMARFFNKEVKPYRKKISLKSWTTLPLSRIIELEKDYDCIMSIPHIYGYGMRSGRNDVFESHEDLLSKAAFFEYINGGTDANGNLRAQRYINSNGKKITAGSDGHSIHRLGKVITEADAGSVEDFLDKVKQGKVKAYGEEANKIMEAVLWLRNKIRL